MYVLLSLSLLFSPLKPLLHKLLFRGPMHFVLCQNSWLSWLFRVATPCGQNSDQVQVPSQPSQYAEYACEIHRQPMRTLRVDVCRFIIAGLLNLHPTPHYGESKLFPRAA